MLPNEAHAARLPLLDGLRGIAALFVMLYHAQMVFAVSGPFSRGYLFVDFFFLLSGFVLTLSAEARMKAGWSTIGFLRARILRIWPMAAVGTLAGAIGLALSGSDDGLTGPVVLGLLMIPALFGNRELFPLNGPQWSLFLELLGNLMHGLLLRRLSDPFLALFVLFCGAVLIVTVTHFGSNTLGPYSFNWWWALPRLGFSYALGILLARRWTKARHNAGRRWWLALAAPGALILLLDRLPLTVPAGDLLIVLAAFPALFWLAATSVTPPVAVRWLTRLGSISFPLYAIHLPVLMLVAALGRHPSTMALAVIATVIAAIAIDRAFAVPRRGRGLRLPGRSQAA